MSGIAEVWLLVRELGCVSRVWRGCGRGVTGRQSDVEVLVPFSIRVRLEIRIESGLGLAYPTCDKSQLRGQEERRGGGLGGERRRIEKE